LIVARPCLASAIVAEITACFDDACDAIEDCFDEVAARHGLK
jgi:hypothetical protein